MFKKIFKVIAISIIPTALLWLPFFLRLESFWGIPLPQNGMATIVANYDGPLFIVAAKSLYNPAIIEQNFAFSLPSTYYAAHFPLFPLLIRAFSGIFGYPYSALFVTSLSSILSVFFFNRLISDYVDKKDAWWMTLIFALFPARWLIVRSVASSEPLFLASIIASFYYFKKKKYLNAGIWGAAAQLTKSPAILLFAAYFLALFIPKLKRAATTTFNKWIGTVDLAKYIKISIIPLSLIAIFVLYKFTYGDFFAYFHSGDNIHLFFPPFQIFDYSQPWVGTFWLEEVIFVYLLVVIGLMKLINAKENDLAWFVGIFFVSILFVSHRDIIRYSLPTVPFLLIAFKDYLVKREFKIAMALIIIPIYLFSISYISQNTMPIADWGPLL
jgi:hypothetical protein